MAEKNTQSLFDNYGEIERLNKVDRMKNHVGGSGRKSPPKRFLPYRRMFLPEWRAMESMVAEANTVYKRNYETFIRTTHSSMQSRADEPSDPRHSQKPCPSPIRTKRAMRKVARCLNCPDPKRIWLRSDKCHLHDPYILEIPKHL